MELSRPFPPIYQVVPDAIRQRKEEVGVRRHVVGRVLPSVAARSPRHAGVAADQPFPVVHHHQLRDDHGRAKAVALGVERLGLVVGHIFLEIHRLLVASRPELVRASFRDPPADHGPV